MQVKEMYRAHIKECRHIMCFLENSSLFGKLSEIDGAAKILRVLCYYVINHEESRGTSQRRVRPHNVVSHNLDGTCNFHIKILSDPALPYLHSTRHTSPGNMSLH